jgi:hypothetical protein
MKAPTREVTNKKKNKKKEKRVKELKCKNFIGLAMKTLYKRVQLKFK